MLTCSESYKSQMSEWVIVLTKKEEKGLEPVCVRRKRGAELAEPLTLSFCPALC